MRDYDEPIAELRLAAERKTITQKTRDACRDAADAIEELVAFARWVAREAIATGDNDGVSAEILCRKLHKLGLTETDGELWTLPAPPKEVSEDA